jgi:hypothetical protein
LVFVRWLTVRRIPQINRTRRTHQSEKRLAMPMPTGFSRKMPNKTGGGFFGGGILREIFTRHA